MSSNAIDVHFAEFELARHAQDRTNDFILPATRLLSGEAQQRNREVNFSALLAAVCPFRTGYAVCYP